MINCIPLNCGLDELLGGGVLTGAVTQVYGPAGAGKTNIGLQAVVNCVRMGKKAVFIDTEGAFNRQRLKQIAGIDYEKVIENTYLIEPHNFKDQSEAMKEMENIDKDVALIVVDSMVYHYRLEKEPSNPLAISQVLGVQAANLLKIARTKNIAVLLTNQVYTNLDTKTIEPVGGDVLKYASKITLALSENPERAAKLVKHMFKKTGSVQRFTIAEKGLV